MDKCFTACGYAEFEVTKADLDRFTDKIENVLNDEKGRKHFRNFMFTCKLRDGRRTLDFWEHIERLLGYREDAESVSFRSYLNDVNRLIDEAERIDELDFATMERLIEAQNSEDHEAIRDALRLLKAEATKALRREYSAYRIHHIPKK